MREDRSRVRGAPREASHSTRGPAALLDSPAQTNGSIGSPVRLEEPPDTAHRLGSGARRLNLWAAIALFGVVLVIAGLAIDTILHATDQDLASHEGLFTASNPGHLLLGIGIALSVAGLSGAATVLVGSTATPPRALKIGQWALRLVVLGLIGTLVYVALGPGFGHDHGNVAVGTEMADGSRLSSAIAADVERSRLPQEQAMALTALSWSREGNVDPTAHDHGQSIGTVPLTAAEQQTLDAQLTLAASVADRYPTPAQAEADGYVQAAPSVNGVGAHWVKWSLVDRPFDPANPSMLLFEEIKWGEGPALVALSYWVYSEEEPEGFAGDGDVWHQHYGLCFEDGWLTWEDLPDRSSCPGDWVNGSDLWMLHAWIVPGLENRYGVFAAVNPKLCERSC